MVHEVNVEELLDLKRRKHAVLIDVRSPSEYEDSTIPGSVNIPLFNDEERAAVGTLYKQESVEAAKQKGLEIVSAKLPSLIREIGETDGKQKVVFCWRGGMRSNTAATLASLMGLQMYRLSGGYRAYRRWVVETLANIRELPPFYVINGFTGTGKTEILDRLHDMGYPVLNLERMAQHRGSIFGHIGRSPMNQKTFEASLVTEFMRLQDAPYLIIEAESRRIGKVVLPEQIIEAKEKGTSVYIDLPMDVRVENILKDYKPEEHKEDCLLSFDRIEKRIHTPVAQEIKQALTTDRFADAVKLLLEHYYDPRYQHASDQYGQERIAVPANSVEEALERIVRLLPPPTHA